MHTLLAALILTADILGSAFFVWAMWRVGDAADQAREQMERDTAQHPDDMRLAA